MATTFFFVVLSLAAVSSKLTRKVINAEIDRCTTIVTGKRAGSEGPMVTHTADCSSCDFRLSKVPAMSWKEKDTRPLYVYRGEYPATVSKKRGATWHPKNLEGSEAQLKAWGTESEVTGFVPQVRHTYALIESGYGIMNEHNVAMGESTCAGRFVSFPTIAGGKAQIEIREMSRIALERTKTAREAILLMGSLAEEYGFYGADWSGGDASLGEAGEALTVADPEEAWVFHVLADDSGTSAIWVAQRVPDDHVAVVANMFTIKEVPRIPSDNFLYSANIFDIAEDHELIEAGAPLNFASVYGLPRSHPTYCTRRVWRVQSLVAPSLNLSSESDVFGSNYAFSVPVEGGVPLAPEDLMRIQRDHYEGTPFDLTQGVAAGPFGDPQRFDASGNENNMTAPELVQGAFERAISMFRTSYSIVAQPRGSLHPLIGPRVWFCPYAPHSSSYAPFYVNQEKIPDPYTHGSLFKYDPTSAFWVHLVVNNYASRFYKFAMQDVFALQAALQSESISKAGELEMKLMKTLKGHHRVDEHTVKHAIEALGDLSESLASRILKGWNDFFPVLVTKYHDGYRAENLDQPTISMHKFFYPKWFLDISDFFSRAPFFGPDVIMFQPSPLRTEDSSSSAFFILCIFVTAIFAAALGYLIGRNKVVDFSLPLRHGTYTQI